MRRISKKLFVSFLFLISTLLTFFWFHLVLFEKTQVGDLISLLISIFFTGSFFLFLILAIEDFKWQAPVFLFASLFIFIFFGFDFLIKISALIFFLSLLLASWQVRNEKEILIKFSFLRILNKGIGIFFLGISLVLAILGFLSPKTLGGKITIPKFLFDFFWPAIEGILKIQYPEVSKETTLNEFLYFQIKKAESGIEDFQKVFPSFFEENLKAQNQKFQDESLSLQIKKISEMVGKELKGDEKIKEILYEVLSNQFLRITKPYEGAGKAGIIFIFFLISRLFFLIYFYLALPFFWIFFIILKKGGFFEIKKVKIKKEEIFI